MLEGSRSQAHGMVVIAVHQHRLWPDAPADAQRYARPPVLVREVVGRQMLDDDAGAIRGGDLQHTIRLAAVAVEGRTDRWTIQRNAIDQYRVGSAGERLGNQTE